MENRDYLIEEKPLKALLILALPMIAGNIFQQFYTMADSMIVGRLVGENALASIGASYALTTVFISIAIGGGVGSSVITSRAFGAKDYQKVKDSAKTAIISFLVIGGLLASFGLAFSENILVLLNTPEMMAMFHLMEEHDVILSICLADGDMQIGEMREVIEECPRLRIAIGHFGMVTVEGWKEQIKLARHPGVMIESGGITWLFNDEFYPFRGAVRAIKEAAELVGMDKLMWGSDYPRTITAITYRMSYDFIQKTTELTDDEKAQFLGRNAERFYGFKHLVDLPYIKNMSE